MAHQKMKSDWGEKIAMMDDYLMRYVVPASSGILFPAPHVPAPVPSPSVLAPIPVPVPVPVVSAPAPIPAPFLPPFSSIVPSNLPPVQYSPSVPPVPFVGQPQSPYIQTSPPPVPPQNLEFTPHFNTFYPAKKFEG